MTPSTVTIVPAGPTHIEDLLPLVREFYQHFGFEWHEPRKREILGEILTSPTVGRVWLAWRGAQSIGYALVIPYLSLELDGRVAVLDEFHVTSSARGQGVGRSLLRHVIAQLDHQGLGWLRLEVDRKHREAASLYAREGFQADGRELWSRRLSEGRGNAGR